MPRVPSLESLIDDYNSLPDEDKLRALDAFHEVYFRYIEATAPDGDGTPVAILDGQSSPQDARAALDVLSDPTRDGLLDLLADELFPLLDPRITGAFVEVFAAMKQGFARRATAAGGETPVTSLGDRQYQIGDCPAILVSEPEDNVLQAFYRCHVMDGPTLTDKSNEDSAVTILKRIHDRWVRLHPGVVLAIRSRPGKGRGYRAVVIATPV